MQGKQISMGVATAVGLGAIIGAGIFVLSGTAIALAGSAAIAVFIVIGILALMVALQSGELGSMFPKSTGSTYTYVYEAFGSELGFITGIIRYFSGTTSISVVALGFGSYLAGLLGFGGSYPIDFGMGIILAITLVNLFGIRKAAKADLALVLIKLAILLAFIGFALYYAFYLGNFSQSNFSLAVPTGIIGGFFAASVVVFFAYSGFQTINSFTAEVKGGAKAAARAIIYSVIISMVLYVLVVLALLLMAPASSYAINADPLALALAAASAPNLLVILVAIGALVATTSAGLAMMLSASRNIYQVSKDRLLPGFLRFYSQKRDVAINGVILSAAIAIVMLFSGNVFIIAAIANFGLLFSYMMTSFALIHFRRAKKEATFRTPWYPWLPILTILALMVMFVGMPQESLVIGVVMVIALIMIYYLLRELENKRIIKVRLFS